MLEAYGARADEYVELFGSLEQLDEADRQLVADWSDGLTEGLILDAGCGPGVWTAYLAGRGREVEGIDLTPEFIAHACRRYPSVRFRVASLAQTGLPDGAVSGVLSWYSLIHTPPSELAGQFAEFRRILAPGGGICLGFFEGEARQPFAHAITTAYYWSVDALSEILEDAGFRVTHVERRQEPGRRPHAAITAFRR